MSRLLEPLLSAPAWLVLVVAGLLVFVEDALFVGFVLPGETAAILAGVAAKLGHVPLWGVLVVVIGAAIIGDSVGYEVGRVLGPRVLSSPRLGRHRARLRDAQNLLARRGGSAVFLGRWVAFFRAVMPALAGSSRMPYRTFLPWNALGGTVWGIAVVLAGYVAGASYKAVEQWLGTGAAAVVGIIVIVGIVVWRVRVYRRDRREEMAERGPRRTAG